MAVTPAAPPEPAAGASPSRRRLWGAGLVVVVAVGFLLMRGLGDATVYFRTADEAVAQRAELGNRRFRIEGSVVPGSVEQDGNEVDFRIRGDAGATVDVTHRGDPPELFQPGVPVVLEGAWAGERYVSDRIMVKHTSEYQSRHPDRVDRYVGQGGGEPAGAPGEGP